jgi:predicted transglutaminase-like cysteine proteinase
LIAPFRHRTRLALGLLVLACALVVAKKEILEITSDMLARVETTYGVSARVRVDDWSKLLARSDFADEMAKVQEVNRFFNKMRFVDDIKHWGDNDYWATPIEFLGSNGGDCEDFSIAKYFTLRHLGVPEERLRMVYVKALKLNQAHMVVAYFPSPDAEPLILDNINKAVVRAGLRRDLQPVYSFNGDGLWLAKERGLGKTPAGKASKLGLWTQLQRRLQGSDWRTAKA